MTYSCEAPEKESEIRGGPGLASAWPLRSTVLAHAGKQLQAVVKPGQRKHCLRGANRIGEKNG
jgi:hypothetical protein